MDLISAGELLVDFVSHEQDAGLVGASAFTRAPGGAPANVAVGLARWGRSTAFLGCLGRDPFGDWLAELVAAEGVDLSHLQRAATARTTLAFVASRSDGRKEIAFYRHPGADAMLSPDELDPLWLGSTRLFHFCSVSLSAEPARTATYRAAELAAAGGAVISFDPNWRAPLWPDETAGRREIARGLELAEIVKVADEELELVCGTTDPDVACDRLLAGRARLAVVTSGAAGCLVATREQRVRLAGHPVQVVDSLGAGDAFVAGLLAGVLEAGGLVLDAGSLARTAAWANAAGALATRRRGVIPALPTRQEVIEFLTEISTDYP